MKKSILLIILFVSLALFIGSSCSNDSNTCETTQSKCDDGNACTEDLCSDRECIYTDIECPTIACYKTYCNPLEGCINEPLQDTCITCPTITLESDDPLLNDGVDNYIKNPFLQNCIKEEGLAVPLGSGCSIIASGTNEKYIDATGKEKTNLRVTFCFKKVW